MTSPSRCDVAAIERAAALLRDGELIGLPTETVYGLAADALNAAAVIKIFRAKGRPADHPLIVHLPDISHLPVWANDIPDQAVMLARVFWPGPLTLILRKTPEVPLEVTGGQETVGIRVPNHPVALALLKVFGSGVAAPSANRFGRISPTTAEHVRDELGDAVSMVLDGGPSSVGIESTILDLSRREPVILRPGAISADDIADVTGVRPLMRQPATDRNSGGEAMTEKPDDSPRVSGSLAAHYAPVTPLCLVEPAQLAETVDGLRAQGKKIAVLAYGVALPSLPDGLLSRAPADAAGFAHDLYARLRALDRIGADLILVEAPPNASQWHAIADRLRRAAAGSGSNG